ncbi:MAG: aldehyde ferredoxin oxidoreductase N-terminal domain-containing protein [Pseudomonadota bacterium]
MERSTGIRLRRTMEEDTDVGLEFSNGQRATKTTANDVVKGGFDMGSCGYAGEILRVDLTKGMVHRLPTADYAERFLGGRGVAAKLHWDGVAPQTKALDPENSLTFMTGPLAGFAGLAGSRWQVCGKSPAMDPGIFSYANAGGSWGAWMKFAGFDGITVTGRSERPVYLYVSDGQAEIRDAAFLSGLTAVETRELLKGALGKEVRIAATGPAGENLVSFATLLADEDSSASSGFGAVMGSKNLKAVAVTGDRRPIAADPERLKALAASLYQMRQGTHLPFTLAIPGRTSRQICYGCIAGCNREVYKGGNGEKGKFFCQSSYVYQKPGMKYYGGWDDVIFHANRLCDKYSLDTGVMEPMIVWLSRCHEEGILTEKETGIPLSKVGSREFIEILVRKISFREGFGDILARGTLQAAALVGKGAGELIGDLIGTRSNEGRAYDPRTYNITGLLWATEPRRPIQQLHEVSMTINQWIQWLKGVKGSFLSKDVFREIARRFWGSEVAADFSSGEGAVLAAKKIQDRTYAKESLILCDWMWPIIWIRNLDDHAGDPSLESKVISAVTGKEVDEGDLNGIGERIFNLQRAILTREGRGGRESDRLLDFFHTRPLESDLFNRRLLVPGPDGEPVSREGRVLEREEFGRMKGEYYELRGWDRRSGLQKGSKLRELGLADVAEDLEVRGLLG